MLRVVLTLALIANGTGSAFAATRMQVESFGTHFTVIDVASSGVSAAAAPCPEHAGMDALAMETSVTPQHLPDDALDNGPHDCCGSDFCFCACVQHAVAGVANAHLMKPLIDRDTTARSPRTGHAAPALPHLIRPPIG